jgi:hypothetical protein
MSIPTINGSTNTSPVAKYRTKIVGNGENPDDWAKKG